MTKFQTSSNKSSSINFPTIRPSLDLDFANSKTLDPRITFIRSSGGSYVGPDGIIKYAGANQPRVDHDPVTGESLGLLIEESRTNLYVGSNDFSNWEKTPTTIVIPNIITAPDGTLTADKLVEGATADSSLHYVFRSPPITSGVTYTVSGYVKSAERSEVFLNFSQFNGAFDTTSFAFFNATTGKFRVIGSSVTNFGSQSLPNGWYRIWITATSIGTTGLSIISPFYISNGNGSGRFYKGDGKSGIYVWGAQVEVGSFPTSYIPTVASTRTRSSDNVSMTGTNFTSWYNQSEGTICVDAKNKVVSNKVDNLFPYLFQFDDGTSANCIALDWTALTSGNYRQNFVVRVNLIFVLSSGFSNLASSGKCSFAFKPRDFCVIDALNTLRNFKTFAPPKLIPTNMIRLRIGQGLGQNFTGTISRFTYYPKRLQDSQLQALTR